MKKSLSKKLNIFKTSPLISAIAILEVIILICVSTFAWFVFAENNNVSTDVISVEPDSGLEIDFNNAAENDYVNIWNYLEEFTFEPVTSLDGRNIFIPTTGTFNSIETSKMVFREGTVNDMNSKYINIDFTLTNTGDEEMKVYLSSKSYFKFNDSANGKALRLAFYQNDGSSGDITSSLLSKEYDGDTPEDPDDPDSPGDSQPTYLVYFDKTGSNWSNVWIEADFTVETGINRRLQMTPISAGSNIYYIDLKSILDDHGSTNFSFMKFHNSTSDNGNDYMSVQLPAGQINPDTMYSFKLDGSNKAYVGNLNGHNGLMLNDPKPYTGTAPDVGGDGSGDDGTGDEDTGETKGQTTVYFYNSLGWEQPHAYIWNDSEDKYANSWPGKPMTHISGDIYYYTFSNYYDSIIFNDGNNEGGAVKTSDIVGVKDGYIYMIGSSNGNNEYGWSTDDYIGSVDGGTYPVISPGVSTGFQRPYAPVIQIDNNNGSANGVIPAFASSIDDYNFGSKELFTIKAGQTLPLSMIVWLEGTDPDCTGDTYAGKDIDMNLVFATKDSGEEMYTYKFLDKTKENWIDDKITTDTGASFNPVMQLYDVDNQKGYQMSVSNDSAGNPTIWTCEAPQDLVNSTHIMFRRVNPMNEDEVWNYWDTSGFKGINGAVVNSEVYFSAFADGAPTNAKNDSSSNPHNAPARSCGGLWGNHETQLVTVYDGTEDQWIKDSKEDGTSSVLTMNYTYNDQTVEYKASGSGKDMYYFVVPMDVYSNQNPTRPAITFKRYYNYNSKHALNSDKNELTFHTSWTSGVCNGKFFQINSSTKTDCYWGSDMLYVQAKEIVTSKMSNSHLQVHFYTTEDGSDESGTSKYIKLNRNDNYKSDVDNGYGYACVIPSDKNYYWYRVERCDPKNTENKWNITPLQKIDTLTSANTQFSNTVGKNICAIENLYLNVYLECSTEYCGDSWDPEIYLSKDNAEEAVWPGTTMTWVQNEAEDSESESSTRYVYFSNDNTNWSNVYVYFFANSQPVGGNWPGTKMTSYDGNYRTAIPSGATHVIFHNNSGTQTPDIEIASTNGTYYYKDGQVKHWDSPPSDAGLATGYKQYKYTVDISRYNNIVFSNDYDHGNQRRQTGNILIGSDSDVNGMIYQWSSTQSRWRTTHKSGELSNETLNAVLYEAENWDKNGS